MPRLGEGHYEYSKKEVVQSDVEAELSDEHRQLLLALYPEVCATWRALMDVRFKLLALVPFVTVAALVILLPGTGSSEELSGWSARSICAVGLTVTLGLMIYEIRNSELYNSLISRGRRIEAELGVRTGIFIGRPRPKWPLVNHSSAVLLIYLAALGGWLFAFCAIERL